MYSRRVIFFIIISLGLLSICLLRLISVQLWSDSYYREKIAELKLQRYQVQPVKTIRGKILDRNQKVLAEDRALFQLQIDYSLTSFADPRIQQAMLLKASESSAAALTETKEKIQNKLDDLQLVIEKCIQFGTGQATIENKIKTINDRIWRLQQFLAWRRNNPDPEILKQYNNINAIPFSVAMTDFAKNIPDPNMRIALSAKIKDVADIKKSWPLMELQTDDDIFAAQVEFLKIKSVKISPITYRYHPFGNVAAQTIGWVGSAQKGNENLFHNDKLTKYLAGEISGREDGVEYICETILRGKRGEVIFDIDKQLANRTEFRPGYDVSLTLDIELQKRIEEYVTNCELNHNCKAPMAIVVIDVESADILSLVSTPDFDLNKARYNYGKLIKDPNEPLRNRAINKTYPPGSVIKPSIFIAGLETGTIYASTVISCSSEGAPKGWPNCWFYKRFRTGHDGEWLNIGRNAIRGSCNVFFSRLASKIDSAILQHWLYKFGYGRKIDLAPEALQKSGVKRNLRQMQGQISDTRTSKSIDSFEQIPPLKKGERRWFGMGQGNLRVTPLQVANTMATIARGGIHKEPRLFIEQRKDAEHSTDLNISKATLDAVLDGMSAVINEPGGTAYKQFQHTSFFEQGVDVYGKTGSTEGTAVAWFGGFAKDKLGRSIALAILVEGGEHGSSDAAPLARNIIQFCLEAGYAGNTN